MLLNNFCSRENNDNEVDTETHHDIQTIYLPQNTGNIDKTNKSDLAIIKLTKDVNNCQQSDGCWPITPVRLADPVKHKTITELTTVRTLGKKLNLFFCHSHVLHYISGWGATEESFVSLKQAEFLAQLDVTVNSSAKEENYYVMETNVGENNEDPCAGDSGGPLLLREVDGEWTLVATLLGGGYSCDDPSSPDKTSDWSTIAPYTPWIRSVIKGISKHILCSIYSL